MLLVDRVKPYLPALNARQTTLRDVAKELQISETYLCTVAKPLLQRVESSTEYRKKRANLKENRTKYREFLANRAQKGEITIETAAVWANCSIRTMYRYLRNFDARVGQKL